MGRGRHVIWVAILVVVAVLVTLVIVGVATSRSEHAPRGACTHGFSSIGPVRIVGGNVVSGSTTPHTQACLH